MGNVTRVHRVGSITAGLSLVVFGCVFLMRLFMENMNYEVVFHFWPIILVGLGVELLISSISGSEKVVYDIGAVVIMVLMLLFAMGMAGMDLLMKYEFLLFF